MSRQPKPLYFQQRYREAEGKKKSYFANRLKGMGINPESDTVITVSGDIALIGIDIANIAVHIRRLNWKTAKYLTI